MFPFLVLVAAAGVISRSLCILNVYANHFLSL